MNQKLMEAEAALQQLLSNSRAMTIHRVFEKLRDKAEEAEVRAALWTLKADGQLEFRDGKVQKTRQAKAA